MTAWTLDPVAVALKFGFLAVLYLFLLWMARCALMKDLRAVGAPARRREPATPPACTGASGASRPARRRRPDAAVAAAAGLRAGYDLASDGAVLGRGDRPTSGSRTVRLLEHARLFAAGGCHVLEDLGSTNGTYLNGEPLRGPQPAACGGHDPYRRHRIPLRA